MSAPHTTTSHRPTSYAGFLGRVERETGLSRAEAERAVRATLRTLGDRLSSGQAHHIASQLPAELAELVDSDTKAQPYDLEEFVRRVAEREGVPVEVAQDHVRGVFAALGRTISHDELRDTASELSKDFGPLLLSARPPPIEQPERPPMVSADVFTDRVASRAGLDRAAAQRAIEAVLEALAERISGGQADDLAEQLPPELRTPLQLGKVRSHAAARPLSLREFVDLVAEQEGVTPDAAHEHAQAVLSTLRESVSPKELSDTLAQLPDEYRALLSPPG